MVSGWLHHNRNAARAAEILLLKISIRINREPVHSFEPALCLYGRAGQPVSYLFTMLAAHIKGQCTAACNI